MANPVGTISKQLYKERYKTNKAIIAGNNCAQLNSINVENSVRGNVPLLKIKVNKLKAPVLAPNHKAEANTGIENKEDIKIFEDILKFAELKIFNTGSNKE